MLKSKHNINTTTIHYVTSNSIKLQVCIKSNWLRSVLENIERITVENTRTTPNVNKQSGKNAIIPRCRRDRKAWAAAVA